MTEEGTLAAESVSDIAIPEGVREALRRRLDRISDEANELLTVAAVVGRAFTYDTLTLLQPVRGDTPQGDADDDALLRQIEEGLEARVIEELPEPGRCRFTHPLMQETLLAKLSTTRRVRLHGQIGEALEARYGEQAEERAPRLAEHFVESADPDAGTRRKGRPLLATRGGRCRGSIRVVRRCSPLRNALSIVDAPESETREDEAELLFGLGDTHSHLQSASTRIAATYRL